MDIMELGAIGELVGGVAVIGSLIFVGIQLRTNTTTLRSTSSYEAFTNINRFNGEMALAPDPEIVIAVSALEDGDFSGTDAPTTARLRYVFRSVFMHWAAQQFLHRQGILDDDLWAQSLRYARGFVATPFGAEWWEKDQHVGTYPPDFVKLVNESEA